MRRHLDVLAQHAAGLFFGEIVDDTSPGFAGRRAFFRIRRSLHHGQNRRLRGSGLAFASAPQARMIGALAWTAADVEFVHLDRAVERMPTGYQQPQSVPHSPGCRLADTTASAKRTEEMPLSDWRMSHKPVSQTRSGSLVECSGVRVVTVN